MKTYFIDNKSDNLILFFNGWSMDENHLARLNSDGYDILICSDYQDISPEALYLEKLNKYSNITLIAWSMGVFTASKFKKYFKNISFSIAINGTLRPIDDKFGIPESIFAATLDNFSGITREKFCKRMFKNNENFENFLLNQPKRDADNQKAELTALQKYINEDKNEENCFDRVIIGKYDKIIPAKNQINYWNQVLTPIIIEEGHYPFFIWQSYQEIIEYVQHN